MAIWPRITGSMCVALMAGTAACSSARPEVHPLPTAPALVAAGAHSIQSDLVQRQPDAVAPALSTLARSAYLAHPSRLWPKGTTLTIDYRRFRRLGRTTGIVPATATGTTSGQWVLLLSFENGRWRVAGTSRRHRP